jgi:3D-(3,5/4)-trihydroxycyclohexane-1,2-dione acylhydrolase (decyclizing)
LADWRAPVDRSVQATQLAAQWNAVVDAARASTPGTLTQSQVIAAVNDAATHDDVVVCAAGSMPGDLHRLWRSTHPQQYHVEYGYSCMGYEIAGGLGVRLARPDGEVYVLVGDGSYLMMAQEIVTAVAEGLKLTIILVDNEGFASIGALSEKVGADRFGTSYGYRDAGSGLFTGGALPVDLAANAASLGARLLPVATLAQLQAALQTAAQAPVTTVIYVRTPQAADGAPDSGAWWDVPVAAVSSMPDTEAARLAYEAGKASQRGYL